jgi:Flp pilus assembly protein TadD
MRSFRRTDRPLVDGLDPSRFQGDAGRLRAAAAHWAEGRLEDADWELSRVQAGPALTAAARLERARLLFLLARLDEAWAELSEIVRLRPEDPEARRYLRVLLALGDPGLAPRLERTLRLLGGRWYFDPGAIGELILNLGLERRDPDFHAVALEQLLAARELQAGSVAVLNNLAIGLAASGRVEEAFSTFRRAVEIDPDHARTHLNLGTLLEREGRTDEAARAYGEAARLDPAWPAPRLRLEALGATRPPR